MNLRRLSLVARNELSFNARRPMFYICLAVIGLIVWGLSTGNVQIVISSGDASVGGKKAWITSEFAIAQIFAVNVSTFMSFFVAAAAGMSVIRDGELRVGELLHATPLTASEYIAGKYLAAIVTALGLLVANIAVMLFFFHVVPNAEMAEFRGPLVLRNYVRPSLVIAVPLLVLITGAAFGLGAWTRKPILVFVLPIALVLGGFFFLWNWSPSWLDLRINRLLMLIDPGGVRWLKETYLEVDRGADFYNTQRIGFDLPFLLSRLTLVLVGVGAVAAGGARFARTLRQSGKVKETKRANAGPIVGDATATNVGAALTLGELGMQSSAAGFWRTVRQVARSEMKELRSQPGLYLFVPLILFQTIGNSLVALGAFDTPLLLTPGTLAVTQMQFMTTLLSLLLVFYAVESMERERSTGFSAIANALPIKTSALVVGKVIALCAIGVIVGVACLLACWIALLVQGRVAFSTWPFVLVWGGLVAPSFLAWAAFVIAAYSVTRSRFSTYGVSLAAFGYTAYLALTDKLNWLGNWPMWNVGAVERHEHARDRSHCARAESPVRARPGRALSPDRHPPVSAPGPRRDSRYATDATGRAAPVVDARRTGPRDPGHRGWNVVAADQGGPGRRTPREKGEGLLEEEPRDVEGRPASRARRGEHGPGARACRAVVDGEGNVRAREQARRPSAESTGHDRRLRGATWHGR